MSFEETHPTGQNNIKIVKFSKRKNYYLYIYEPQTRKVGYSSMGSYDLEYCKKNWFKVYQEYVDKGGSKRQIRRTDILLKLKEYTDYLLTRVEREEIKNSSFNTHWERIRNRITPYIKEKKIKSIQELNRRSYMDFSIYWKDKGYEIETIKSDKSTFDTFLKWLVDEELLDLGKKPVLGKLKQVKDHRKESNPSFTGKDWEVFNDYLTRYEYRDEGPTDDMDLLEKMWYRKNFIHWVWFQYHSGNRPHETSKMTYGDVTYKEHTLPSGKKTLMGIIKIPYDTKRGHRTSLMNGHYIKRILNHVHSFKHKKWLSVELNDNTPLFLNPMTGKTIHQESFRHHFKEVLKLSGLDNKGYTPYSLRSTHITMMLLRGTSRDDISRNLGTSPEMIRRHYENVENILKSKELLKLNREYYEDSKYTETIEF